MCEDVRLIALIRTFIRIIFFESLLSNISDNAENADLWLLNSCTVKNPAEDHFRNEITKAQEKGKHLVLSGCVPQAQPRAGYLQGVSAVGVQQIDRVVEVVEETLKGNAFHFLQYSCVMHM